jgi:putative aminopeptidase FrvX
VFTELDFPNTTITETGKGALLLHIGGERHDAPVGVTAHADTLGFMVKEIKSNGSLKLSNIGGINWSGAEFENCTVRTHADQRYRGTVILSDPSTHVNRHAHKSERTEDTMEIRLDARTTSRRETEALGIGVGDFIFLDPRVEVTDTGFIRSRFLDDKASVACIYGALAAMQAAGVIPVQDTYVLISNYEEVGHGGSAGFPPNLAELLTIDMGALGNGQAGDEFSVSICVKDSGGPYHFEMNNKLRRLAEAYQIAYKVDIYPFYSSDGTAYWRAGGDARVGLIGPGVASSHGYERTHQEGLQHSAHLIARYLLDA